MGYRVPSYIAYLLVVSAQPGRMATEEDSRREQDGVGLVGEEAVADEASGEGVWAGAREIDHREVHVDTGFMRMFVTDRKVRRVNVMAWK